ncbi:hypothetical protein TSAR_003798, partial [Trichomalopsis sarcophagae]
SPERFPKKVVLHNLNHPETCSTTVKICQSPTQSSASYLFHTTTTIVAARSTLLLGIFMHSGLSPSLSKFFFLYTIITQYDILLLQLYFILGKYTGDDEQLLVPTSCKSCTDVIAMRNSRKCDKCGYHPNKPASTPPSRSSSSSHKEDPVLNKILDKLNKLDNVEKHQNEMNNQLSESKSSLEKGMTDIEKSLELLKEIPALINRVTVVEGNVAALRSEQEKIKAKLEQLLISGAGSSSSPSNAPALCTETIQQFREANTRIQAQLDSVTSSQAKLSAELVITGLTFSETTSLRHLAYAALRPLDAELTERDIISVRSLGR